MATVEKLSLEEVVARNRPKKGEALEYEKMCDAIRRWLAAETEALDLVLARRANRKVFLSGIGFKGGKFRAQVESVKRHEIETARTIGGKLQPHSGRISGIGGKGDAKSDQFIADAKQTDSASMNIRFDWVQKLCDDASGLGKDPLFHLRWNNLVSGYPKDWVMMPAPVFERLAGSD